MPKLQKKPKTVRRPRLLPIALLLLSTAALIAVFGGMSPAWPSPAEPAPASASQTVRVNDGVRTVRLTPKPDVPVSGLASEAFSVQDGLVVYDGAARQGIDVSEHQGAIDWQQVADSGVSFVFIRLGYRGATEGQLHVDGRFEENLAGARAAGVEAGVYFFSQALDEGEALEEADFVTDTLAGRALDLPVMFDWEPVDQKNSRTAGAKWRAMTDRAAAFCRRVEDAGYDAGVYFNRQQGYYSYDLSALKDYAFWVAEPAERPTFYYAFCFWQYSFTGAVPGINTVVDRDLMFEEGENSG